MQKRMLFIRKQVMLFSLSLFVSSMLFANSHVANTNLYKTANHKNYFEVPVLTEKSSLVEGTQTTFTYNISFLDDAVQIALNQIKNVNRPGAYIGIEFFVFEVDKGTKTVKVAVTTGVATQLSVKDFLQKQLNNILKPA